MSVADINNVHFDTIIIGSSLTNCITFAALCRAGYKVALFEPQQWHGFLNASMSLSDFHQLVKIIENETPTLDQQEKMPRPNYLYCDIANERSKPPQKTRIRNMHGAVEIDYGPENQPEEGLASNLRETIERHLRRSKIQSNRLKILEDVYLKRRIEIEERQAQEEIRKEKERQEKENKAECQNNLNGPNDNDSLSLEPEDKQIPQQQFNYPDEIEETLLELMAKFKLKTQTLDQSENTQSTGQIDEDAFLVALREKLQQKLPYEVLTGELPFDQLAASQHICVPFPSFNNDFLTSINDPCVVQSGAWMSAGGNSNQGGGSLGEGEGEASLENQREEINVSLVNQTIAKPFPFPIHNAHEYTCDSALPISTQHKTKQDQSLRLETSNPQTENDDQKSSEPQPQHPYQPLIKKSGFRHIVDLLHQEIYATSLAIKSIVDSKLHEYHEFRAINKTTLLYPFQETPVHIQPQFNDLKGSFQYRPEAIPASKQDIFSSQSLSLRAKHKLSSILLIIQHDKRNTQCTPWHHAMYEAYKMRPIGDLIFHVCNPQYSPEQSATPSPFAVLNPFAALSAMATMVTDVSTSVLSASAAGIGGVTTNQEEQEGQEECRKELKEQQKTYSVQALPFIHPSDFHNDQDAITITEILSYGLSHYLPAVYPTKDTPKTKQQKQPKQEQLLTSTVSTAILQHVQSIGRYSSSAYLYPVYGIGEICQAWIYNACVWGGFGIVRMALAGIILPRTFVQNSVETAETAANIHKNKRNKKDVITLLTQSGQLITTHSLVCDRIMSPFDIDQLECIEYRGLDGGENEIQIESKDDNLVQPTHIVASTHFTSQRAQIVHNIKTTQHVVLIVDELPQHWNDQNLHKDQVSIQSFIIPSASKDTIANNITAAIHGTPSPSTENSSSPQTDDILNSLQTASSKVFITEESVGLSSGGNYMVSITTTLLSTICDDSSLIQPEYLRQVEFATNIMSSEPSNTNSSETRFTATADGDGAQNPTSILPQILLTLPQLAPFFQVTTQPQDKPTLLPDELQVDGMNANVSVVKTDHVKYIASYCCTSVNYSSTADGPLTPASAVRYTTTQPRTQFETPEEEEEKKEEKKEAKEKKTVPGAKEHVPSVYPYVFITPDIDQGKITVEDSFILASHQFYAVMNYQQENSDPESPQGAKPAMLSFLMTKKQEIIDEATGQALQLLEERNPQLAHTMEIMDSLEVQLEHLAQIESKADTPVDHDTPLENDDNGSDSNGASQDEAHILTSLDQLDLSELDGLDF